MDIFWKKPNWETEDKHLKRLKAMPFRREFPDLKVSEGLQSIRGPRQVGKSSWLKTLLSQETKKGKDCFFFSCEELKDFKELSELIKPLKKIDVIFLDEISFVSEWDRSIKHFIDSGFEGAIVVTGSNAFDLRQGIDRMPGRWAKDGIGEYNLLPMGFHEWLKMREQAGWSNASSLRENLASFFRIGGFPSSLLEAGPENKDPVGAKQTYLRWLIGDVRRKNRQEIYLKELLGQLALTQTSTLSLQTLAQKTQMMSYHTAQDYISVLEDCFALRTLYCMDPETSAIRYKKQKKYYFTDPLIYWIALDWAGHKSDVGWEEKLAEMVAHEALARRVKRMGYLSTPKGEVDFFSPKSWALEVKWAPVPKNISRAYHDLLIPRKVVWSFSNFLMEWPDKN